jgi:RDD family protein
VSVITGGGLAPRKVTLVMPVARPGYRYGVTERRWTGSWLSGTSASGDESSYPGERFGLAADGAGSVASMGKRMLALLIDWLLCMVISLGAWRSQAWTLPIFAGETYLLTALTGFTVGKRIIGIRVARLDSRPVGLGWAAVRTVLLLAVVPPLITDGDLRGLHDRAANTIVVRSR